MKQFALFIFSLLLAIDATAQAPLALDGPWTAEITPEGRSTFDFRFYFEDEADSLHMWMPSETGRVYLEDVSLVEGRLSFTIPMHGTGVECSMVWKEGSFFAGVCVGPMGESVARLAPYVSSNDIAE